MPPSPPWLGRTCSHYVTCGEASSYASKTQWPSSCQDLCVAAPCCPVIMPPLRQHWDHPLAAAWQNQSFGHHYYSPPCMGGQPHAELTCTDLPGSTCRVGTAQNWESDWGSFTPAMKGAVLASDANQVWVDVRAPTVRSIMSQVSSHLVIYIPPPMLTSRWFARTAPCKGHDSYPAE